MIRDKDEKIFNLENKKEVLTERRLKLVEKKEKINEEIKSIDYKIESVESEIAVQKMNETMNLLEGTGINFREIMEAIKSKNFNNIQNKIQDRNVETESQTYNYEENNEV